MAKAPALTIPSSKVAIALAAGTVAAGMKTAEATAGKLYNVPVGKVKVIPGFNVRVNTPDYVAHRDMIAESIRNNGYDETKPLSGYVAKEGDENVIYVTDGHTRLDAVNALNADEDVVSTGKTIDKVPVVVRATAPSLAELTVALHTNNTGRPLTPFELGVVVKRLLKEDGADKASIAKSLSITPRYVDDVLLLVNSPKVVRTAVLEGKVSSTMAIQTLRKDPEKAADKIEAAVAKATAAGKSKATAKDTGPKMQKIKTSVSVAEGTDMKEIVKAVAANVRAAIVANSDGEGEDAIKVAAVDGTITIVVEVPAPVKADPVVAAAAKKPAAKKTPAAKKPAAAKKGAAKKPAAEKAAPEPAADENISADDDDLGIDGAEELTSENQDDEVAILPPAMGDKDDEDNSI